MYTSSNCKKGKYLSKVHQNSLPQPRNLKRGSGIEAVKDLWQQTGKSLNKYLLLTGSNNQFQNYKTMYNLNFSRKKPMAKKKQIYSNHWEEGYLLNCVYFQKIVFLSPYCVFQIKFVYVPVIFKTLEHIETFDTNCKVLS